MRICLGSLVICLFFAAPAMAQNYLRDGGAPIARHDKRNSGVVLKDPKSSDSTDNWGLMFEDSMWQSSADEENRLISYLELPNCRSAEVKLLPISHHSMGTDGIDVIYYSAADPVQMREAKKQGVKAIAYQAALLRDAESQLPDPAQEFARFLQISCLPTRFRFTYAGNQRFAEYRFGKAAWEATPQDSKAITGE